MYEKYAMERIYKIIYTLIAMERLENNPDLFYCP